MTHVSENILIVDDTPKNIQVLGTILREYGYDCVLAQSGQQALKAVESVPIDLILLDIIMPEMDGFEVCRHLKRDPKTKNIPIIFLTSKVETKDISKGFELGAADYVTKPFQIDELLARIRTHLDFHKYRTALEHHRIALELHIEDMARIKREHEAFLRHELNNQLQPILGYSQLLVEDGETSEATHHQAQAIFDSAHRLKDLVTALRNLEDLESGAYNLTKTSVTLNSMISQIIEDLTMCFTNTDISFAQHAQITIEADSGLLDGLLRNLIKNAVEHVDELTDESARRASIKLFQEDHHATITIQNGGTPIPIERLKRFFEKFNTDRSKAGGTGLGTTYAYWVTKTHNGHISVTSDTEAGTIVTIRLPLS